MGISTARNLHHCQTRISLAVVGSTTKTSTAIKHPKSTPARSSHSKMDRNESNIQSRKATMFPLTPFHGPQKRWDSETHIRPQSVEQIYRSYSFSNDKPYNCLKAPQTSSHVCFTRSHRGLHAHTYQSKFTQIPGLFVQKRPILFQSSAIRPQPSTIYIHQNPVMATEPSTSGRCGCSRLPRRLVSLAPIGNSSFQRSKSYNATTAITGLYNQCKEISLNPNFRTRMVGNHVERSNGRVADATTKATTNKQTSQTPLTLKDNNTPSVGGPPGKYKLCVPSALPSSTTVSNSVESNCYCGFVPS